MKIAHAQAVKKHLGEDSNVLSDLFQRCRGAPQGVPIHRYRADHPEWIDALDRLEAGQDFLIRHRSNNNNYFVRVVALPVLGEARAGRLMDLMEALYGEFRKVYRQRLAERVSISEILAICADKLKVDDEELIKEALSYMSDSHSVWAGLSNDFPYAEGSYLCISENVLRHSRFSEIISQFYEWHIVNAKTRAENANPYAMLAFGKSKRKVNKKARPRRARATSFLAIAGGNQPHWYDKLDDSKKALLSEIDKAIAVGLAALPTMGIRSLLEQIMREHVEEQRSFKDNIDAFHAAGFITKQHALLVEFI